ncbi:AT-hook motif nuclear-localized protein [Heracleum sosnowskyi]|uniref:AT-hook motif nuclear-localized protein n=1 Tax=Heracleum sosnowskyi TaxID=360622 RepID=A0AAD8HWQ4_9APIA|nr:AT-hook motif nuclear-localized protein [Heracleum sosnowskyi]
MDGREGIALSGSPPYYFNTAVSGSGPNSGSIYGSAEESQLTHPTAFKNLASPNLSIQTNVGGLAYQSEDPSLNFSQGINVGVGSSVSLSDSGKKKRGRPRKYGPDGVNMSLALSPLSSNPSTGDVMQVEGEKKNRGRPRGSGRKQRLASLGEWMNTSAGMAFTPHVIHIAQGEDIASKLLAFAQQRPRALCVMSASGSVSEVTLRQPMSSDSTLTYEGHFEILCLSGSYLVSDEGGPRNRAGGLSISVCTPDGLVIGGAIGGRLIAASLVQAIVCSFVYDGLKTKTEVDVKGEQTSEAHPNESPSKPPHLDTTQNMDPNPEVAHWPPSSRPDVRDLNTEIDLA